MCKYYVFVATISVGPSPDSANVTMVDSIKVYVKTKESFGWPEDESSADQMKLQSATDGSATTGLTLTSALAIHARMALMGVPNW